jgi:hypothetical protein
MLDRQADKKLETVETKKQGQLIAFGPITTLAISQDNNPRLSLKGHELFVFLDSQKAHCWDGLRRAFLS